MKDKILKIAKCKTEAEFYKKYPSEEAFMKVHGKEFRKAQLGTNIQKAQNGEVISSYGDNLLNNPTNYNTPQNYAPEYMDNFKSYGLTDDANSKIDKNSNQVLIANSLNSFTPKPLVTPNSNSLMPKQLGYNLSGDSSKQQFGLDRSLIKGQTIQQIDSGVPQAPQISGNSGGGDLLGSLTKLTQGPTQEVAQGIVDLIGEKKKKAKAEQWNDVSKLTLQASRTKPEEATRMYDRPEDNSFTRENLFPVNGVGTNPLAKDGKTIRFQSGGDLTKLLGSIGGNGGGDLSSMMGGNSGGSPDPYGMMASKLSGAMTAISGKNAGGELGGTAGKYVGEAIGGPAGAAIGQLVGQGAGTLIDRTPMKTNKLNANTMQNIRMMGIANGMQGAQQQYSSFMQNGGNAPLDGDLQVYNGEAIPMSYNPNLPDNGETVMFKGPSHENGGIDTSFGNTSIEVEGGEPAVKTQDDNLVVFGNLSIPKGYLDDPNAKNQKFKNYIVSLSKVENKQNKIIESATDKLADMPIQTPFDKLDFSTQKANTIGANMALKDIANKKQQAAHLQDAINQTADEHGLVAEDLAKGKIKKAKNGASIKAATGADFVKNIVDNTSNVPSNTYPGITPIDTTQVNSTPVQRSSVGHLGEGNYLDYDSIRKEKEEGNFVLPHQNADPRNSPYYGGVSAQKIASSWPKEVLQDAGLDPLHPEKWGADAPSKIQATVKSKYPDMYKQLKDKTSPTANDFGLDWFSLGKGNQPSSLSMKLPEPLPPQVITNNAPKMEAIPVENRPTTENKTKPNWLNTVGNMLPFFRPSNAEPLDPRSLSGEMFALSNNQLEPVKAQGYHPQLNVPYDISLQDQLNENQADFRSMQRLSEGNPAMQSILAAQKYGANEKVLGDQFRMNQAEKDKVYSGNRAELNDAQLKNLGIYDQQYQRQSEAKSNTKVATQAVLNSISDKFAKNQLENKTLQTYENLYNYRYDNNGRAVNMNAPAQFNIPNVGNTQAGGPITIGGKTFYPQYKAGKLLNYQPAESATVDEPDIGGKTTPIKTKRNGALLKAIRGL